MKSIKFGVQDVSPCGGRLCYVDHDKDTEACRKIHNEQEFKKFEGAIHLHALISVKTE